MAYEFEYSETFNGNTVTVKTDALYPSATTEELGKLIEHIHKLIETENAE